MASRAPLEGVRRMFRRVFFWLPSSVAHEEQPPEAHHDHHLVIAVTAPERVPRMRQIRYALRVLSDKERRIVMIAGIIGCISLLAASAMYVREHALRVPVAGGSVTEALVGQPKYINPLDARLNDVDADLSQLIYSGLFRMEGLEPVPDLAEQFSWSEDRKILTVKLRSDARFHDESPVTADDIRFTYDTLLDPARKSPLLPLFRGVVIDSDPEDRSIIRFTLAKPDPTFLHSLTIGILPAHLWSDIPAENARLSDLNIKPIGSGPYRVKSFLRDTIGNIHSYTLERFDHFYGVKPNLSNIIFQFFPDAQSALDAFTSDAVEAVAFVPTGDMEKGTLSTRTHTMTLEMPEVTVAFFNIKDKTLSSKDVRQALSLSVSRTEIVNALHGKAQPAFGPYPFEATSSTEPDVPRARDLLSQAGWPLPQDGNVRATASGTEFALTISVPDERDLMTVADVLKREWSLMGARTTVETLPADELMRKATRSRTAQIILLNIFLGAEQDLFPFWWSGQTADRGLNFSNLADRATDDALEATRAATTTEGLAAARAAVTATIHKLTPAVFLIRPARQYLVSSSIRGVSDSRTISRPSERLTDTMQWYKKSGWRWK